VEPCHDANVTYEFDAELWLWNPDEGGTWTFLSLPPEIADEVLEVARPVARGFGSVRVEVKIGESTWQTSLFPSNSRKTYVLPVKKSVRRDERVDAGDVVRVRVKVLGVAETPASGGGPHGNERKRKSRGQA
jgi:hypothetical protein